MGQATDHQRRVTQNWGDGRELLIQWCTGMDGSDGGDASLCFVRAMILLSCR